MIDYSKTYQKLQDSGFSSWMDVLPQQIEKVFKSNRWGDLPKWLKAVDELPLIQPSSIDLNSDTVRVGEEQGCDDSGRDVIREILMKLHPWRKGPFELFGLEVETEWRSDLKWNRLKNHVNLKNKTVLDIGCGSGYHCWRMKGAGAKLVIGIDPTLLYPIQFQAFQKYIQDYSVNVFPIGVDDLDQASVQFDCVFSMGLLYHRRSPLDHLLQIRDLLKEDGEIVLETIVIDGEEGEVLTPLGRYACMPNVWFLPSCLTLETWLKKMKFKDVRCVDVTTTTSDEQRVTPWMGFQSLENFLDPQDQTKTVEGYPAPKRAVFIAKK